MPLTLGVAASAASESAEGNNLGLVLDVVEEGKSALQLHAVDGLGGLAGVLERNTEVGTASAGGLGRLDVGGGVTDLVVKFMVRTMFVSNRKGAVETLNFAMAQIERLASRMLTYHLD